MSVGLEQLFYQKVEDALALTLKQTLPHCLTIDEFYVPAASCPIRYDCKQERGSVGGVVFIKGSDVHRLFVRAQTGMGRGQGGTVVVGVGDLNGDCARGCL